MLTPFHTHGRRCVAEVRSQPLLLCCTLMCDEINMQSTSKVCASTVKDMGHFSEVVVNSSKCSKCWQVLQDRVLALESQVTRTSLCASFIALVGLAAASYAMPVRGHHACAVTLVCIKCAGEMMGHHEGGGGGMSGGGMGGGGMGAGAPTVIENNYYGANPQVQQGNQVGNAAAGCLLCRLHVRVMSSYFQLAVMEWQCRLQGSSTVQNSSWKC